MTSNLVVDYYTDILCIWAWIAQRRIEELEAQWGEQITLNCHYLNLFGDTTSRIETQWSERGGFVGFGQHVVDAAAPYDNAPVHQDIWTRVRPATSANAHLVIEAVTITNSAAAAADLAVRIRRAFFIEALDIAQLPVLYDIAASTDLDEASIRSSLTDGTAAAALMSDYQAAQMQNISGSPSWVMDGGRQKLYGNVGYHVLNANIEGLLSKHGEEDASWC